jgi:hypothetical protein
VPDDWLTDTIISLFFAGRARFLSTIYTSGHTGYDSDPFGHPSQHRQRQPSKRGAHTVKAIRSPGTPANRKEAPGSHRLYLSLLFIFFISLSFPLHPLTTNHHFECILLYRVSTPRAIPHSATQRISTARMNYGKTYGRSFLRLCDSNVSPPPIPCPPFVQNYICTVVLAERWIIQW